VLENVTATGGANAGAIVGLPESPVTGVVLRNVKISAEHGLTIGYAEVTGSGVLVEAGEGQGITQAVGAKVNLK
jgi:hypothetical protein